MSGTYSMIQLTNESRNDLVQFVQENIKTNKIVDPKEYHVTLCYSRTDLDPKVFELEKLDEIIKTSPKKFSLFDVKNQEENYCLVLEVESEDLVYINSKLKEYGATSDYPEYKPHITVAYMNDKINIDDLQIPDFTIELQGIEFSDLNLDFKAKQLET